MESDHFGLGDLGRPDTDDFGPLDTDDLAPVDRSPADRSPADEKHRPEPEAESPTGSEAGTLSLPTSATVTSDVPPSVHIDWSGDRPLAITVDPNWRTRGGPEAMLRAVRESVNEHLGTKASWLAGVRVGDVPLERLGEFNALLAEALDEEQLDTVQPARVDREHLTSVWLEGSLMAIECDPDWLAHVSPEHLDDALVDICSRPRATESHSTTARNRLTAFLGGHHE